MSRSDIADHLGLNADTVSRSLARLAKLGVIEIPNIHEVVIVDSSRLEASADGEHDLSMFETAALPA